MNATKMTNTHPDMFHDEAAHRIEWRLGVPFGIAAAILAIYVLVYQLF